MGVARVVVKGVVSFPEVSFSFGFTGSVTDTLSSAAPSADFACIRIAMADSSSLSVLNRSRTSLGVVMFSRDGVVVSNPS